MTLYLGTEKVTPTITTGGGSANIQSLNVTPSINAQTITASGGVDGYSPINVSAVILKELTYYLIKEFSQFIINII